MIQQLTLENFKCFERLELETKPLTLVTGINGMGKSSVIQSLLMLRQSYDVKFLQAQNKVLVNGELVDLIDGNAIRYSLSSSSKVNISIEYSNGHKFSVGIQAESKNEALECSFDSNQNLNTISIFDENFVYLSAERLGPRAVYPKTQSFNHKGRLGTGRATLTASYLSLCLREGTALPIQKLRHPDEKSNLIYQNVSAWLSEIAYDGTQIGASDESKDQIVLSYSFNKGIYKGYDFSPVNVGFGFSYILPIILAVLSAKPGSLILIENPEAHLHPAAQSKIGKLLALAAANGVQLIIETHSDHLLNGIRVLVKGDDKFGKIETENIITHFFTTEQEGDIGRRYKETLRISPNGQMDDWPVGFFDEWENNLNKIIF